MAGELRILHLADSHIGAELPARPRSRRRSRGDDLIDSYRRVLARAREFDVHLVLHGGDVFDRPTPHGPALQAASAPLLELAHDGIPVVVVPGNHERSSLPSSLFMAHDNIYVVDRPRTITVRTNGVRVAIAGLPCVRRNVARDFDAALAATQWQDAPADMRVLLLHQTIESAVCGPVGYRFRSGEDVLDRDRVPNAFDYVALGHVHRRQTLESLLPGGPPFVYPGSPDRISFAERDEPKGCVLIRWDAGRTRHEFLEHPVRPMEVHPLDVTALPRPQLEEALFDIIRQAAPDALVQLRLSGHASARTLRGLRLQRRGEELRPDVQLGVSMQQIVLAADRPPATAARGGSASAFSALPTGRPLKPIPCGGSESSLSPPIPGAVSGPIDVLAQLEDSCGTYALRDRFGRLLYVGKALKLRTRLRSHLNGRGGAEFFQGWARQVAGFEARGAWSELEALLVEAELIRTLRPPFNRQMKSWSRYGYLAIGRLPHGQIEFTAETDNDEALSDRRRQRRASTVFIGPYRSRMSAEAAIEAAAAVFAAALCPEDHGAALPLLRRETTDAGRRVVAAADACSRFYAGLCSGPCAGRVAPEAYAGQLAARDALLTGRDGSVALLWEAEVERRAAAGEPDEDLKPYEQTAGTMRFMFDQGRTLQASEALIGGIVLLPGGPDARVAAIFSPERLRLMPLRTPDDARRAWATAREAGRGRAVNATACVPKALADTLGTVVRYAARRPEAIALLPRNEIATGSASRAAQRLLGFALHAAVAPDDGEKAAGGANALPMGLAAS